MNILVVNSGSSSLKFKLVNSITGVNLASGILERIGLDKGRIKYSTLRCEQYTVERSIKDHDIGISLLLDILTDHEKGAIDSLSEIDAVGHRVVHGGNSFSDSIIIDEKVIKTIEDCSFMAPLHNPPNLLGIRAAMKKLPGIPNVAVFDTAFHQTMPPVAYIYPLPYSVFSEKGIRKFGFHGTSHLYVAQKAAEMIGKPLEELSIITCHLGNGSSITAVKHGKSIDTSLGFGTVCGVMMGTRSGDVDPAVIIELMENQGMNVLEIKTMLYKESGVLEISGVSSDMRDVEEADSSGNKRATLALEMFADRVRKHIGAYAVTMGALDAVVLLRA